MARCSPEELEVEVRWKPFLLRPDMPAEGKPKAPATPDNPRVGARLKGAGAAVGIDFSGKCDTYPNTLQAHALMEYVLAHHGPAAQNALAERLFQAYFTDGTCPMGADVLARLAAEALPALSEGEVGACRAHVASGAGEAGALRAASEVSASGVSGVPMFYFDGAPAFSGAQPEEAFLEAFSRC